MMRDVWQVLRDLWDEVPGIPYALGVLTGLLLLLLTACTPQPLVGSPVDLTTIAQPDPVIMTPLVPTITPPPVVVPAPAPEWRAWIPPTQAPNGDVEEGHWVTISPQAPAVEELEPAVPMPRAPRDYTPNRQVRSQTRSSTGPQRPPSPSPQSPALVPGASVTPAPVPQPATPLVVPPQYVQPAPPSSAYSEAVSRLQSLTGTAPTAPSTPVLLGGPGR